MDNDMDKEKIVLNSPVDSDDDVEVEAEVEAEVDIIEKDNIYCGDKDNLPEDYDRNGSRHECMKKGYGSAFYNADISDMKKAREKSNKKIRILSKRELFKLAKRLNINYTDKDKLVILKNVINIFNKMKKKIEKE